MLENLTCTLGNVGFARIRRVSEPGYVSFDKEKVAAVKRSKTVRSGKDHPRYKHGERTQEAIEQFRSKMLEL